MRRELPFVDHGLVGGDQPDAGTLQLKTRAAEIQRLVLSGITRESGEMRWHQPWIQQIRA